MKFNWLAPSSTRSGSPPSRRRGLKSPLPPKPSVPVTVASFAEAWIEIVTVRDSFVKRTSPPSRRRGLKLFPDSQRGAMQVVASFAEAWIEILVSPALLL